MCKKFISVADISSQNEFPEIINPDGIPPIVTEVRENVGGETIVIEGVEVHKRGKCREGGKICSLCDYFKIERIEVPACPKRCKCRVNSQQIQDLKKLKDLDSVLDNQVNHACQKIIIGIREKYPERHVVIVDCGTFFGVEHEMVFGEILVFKRPNLLKEINGNPNCKCQTKSVVNSMKEKIFASLPGSEIFKLEQIKERLFTKMLFEAHANFMFNHMINSMFMDSDEDDEDDEDDDDDEEEYGSEYGSENDDDDDEDDDDEWIDIDTSSDSE